jgi:3-phosphoshikimate 1-carboxyvinyltransferase
MKVEVFPSELGGQAKVPGSKSVAQRLALAALMAKGESVLLDFPDSEDCKAVVRVVQQLGAVVQQRGTTVSIKGGFTDAFHAGIRNPKSEIDCGESGLASRMFIPVCALHDSPITVNGHGTLLTRPFHVYQDVLPKLGVEFQSNKGLLPVRVHGPLKGGKITLDGSLSSQFLTGMLFALPSSDKASTVSVTNPSSIPYIQTTLEVLQLFGVEIKHKNYTSYSITPRQQFKPQQIAVPGDWSGAAFILVAAALCSDEGILVTNLSTAFTQADSEVIEVLKRSGAVVRKSTQGIFVKKGEVRAFDWDGTHCPDLFPILVVLAAFGDGVSTFKGAGRLVHKESNRSKVLQEEFAKAGVRILVRDDEMKVYPSSIRPAVINSHNDHRIAMSAAVLAMAGAKMTIQGAECVSKSFAEFFEVIESLGARIKRRR